MCVGTHLLVKSSEQRKKKKPRKVFTASRGRLKIQDSRHDAGSLFTASPQTRRRLTLEGLTQGSAVRVRWGREGGRGGMLENKVQIVFARANVNFCERQSAGGRDGLPTLSHSNASAVGGWGGRGVDGGGGGAWSVCLSVCLLLALGVR